jgi:putative membrane protein
MNNTDNIIYNHCIDFNVDLRGKFMSSTKNVMGLSKYMLTLPQTKTSLFTIIFLSFAVGSIGFLVNPAPGTDVIQNILYGGAGGFVIFGLSAIMSGAMTQPWINSLKGRKMKMKQSMFLSLFCMGIISIIYILGCAVSNILNQDLVLNSLIFGIAVAFAFRTLAIWGTSNINLTNSVLISGTQPGLFICLLIVTMFLTTNTIDIGAFGVIAFLLKIIIACAILVIAIYSFVLVIESPMRKNLGVGGLELLSLFISHITEGSSALEGVFEDIGEPIDTLVGVVSFKTASGIKALFVSPCVHPGPVGSIGGGNMPTSLAESFEPFTMVAHGPSTHDFNPVSTKEIFKVEKVIKDSLDEISYTSKASKFLRVSYENAKIGAQFFGDDLLLTATFAPHGFDDIDFGVGLSLINLARSQCDSENVILVDCHNSFKGESGRVLPGNKEVFELMGAVEKIECLEKSGIKAGCSHNLMGELSRVEGIGQSGVKVLVTEVADQKTAYILLDSNNMVIGFREKILEKVKSLGIDEAEVMTTDTHSVNTLAGGHNPVGKKSQDHILDYIIQTTKEALNDVESVCVGCKVSRIKDLKTFGPNNATELVTTISSIVAVSRIFAPLVFILAILFVFVWTFYGVF